MAGPILSMVAHGEWVHNGLQRIIKDWSFLDNAYVAVGWDQYSGRYPTGQAVAQVAVWNEFGTHNEDGSVRNPARPFIRPAYDDNRPALSSLRTQVVDAVNSGKMTPYKALNTLGFRMQLWIQAKIKANPAPALRPRTLAKKRAAGRPAVTLIDTRRMLDTLTYKIYLGRFGSGSQTGQAKGAQAAAQRITGDTAHKQEQRKNALGAKVMAAQQIKREKNYLRQELHKAKNQKKRLLAREVKKQRAADKAQRHADSRAFKKHKNEERRAVKNEAHKLQMAENRARKQTKSRRKAYTKQFKAAVKNKSAYDKRMAKRDKRQKMGLPRIEKLTAKQKAARASREKLKAGNRARLRTERKIDRKEQRAEKTVAAKIKMNARRATKAQKKAQVKTQKANKEAKMKAAKQVKAKLKSFLSSIEKGLT